MGTYCWKAKDLNQLLEIRGWEPTAGDQRIGTYY
jgi:hypothetical protein